LLILVSVLAFVAVLATEGTALAANQVRGGKYSGTIHSNGGLAISFKVSSTGKDVIRMKVPQPPASCPGGGPPPPQLRAKPAPISSAGNFKETLKYGTTGSIVVTLKVTGTFHAHRKESGKVTPTWSDTSCDATVGYSTKA
jgi:hypothetical protein